MLHRLHRFPLAAVTAAVLALGAAPTLAQETSRVEVEVQADADGERRAFVFRGGDGEVVRLRPHFVFGSFLGVRTVEMTPELRAHFGVPETVGVMVSEVVEDSPAAAAGVAVGDVLTRLSDQDVRSAFDLIAALRSQEPGTEVDLEVWRSGRSHTLTATLSGSRHPSFDVSPIVRRIVERDGHVLDDREVVEIDSERIGEAMVRLRERMESGDIAQSIERVRTERLAMESRIEELEARLRELEAELRRLTRDDG